MWQWSFNCYLPFFLTNCADAIKTKWKVKQFSTKFEKIQIPAPNHSVKSAAAPCPCFHQWSHFAFVLLTQWQGLSNIFKYMKQNPMSSSFPCSLPSFFCLALGGIIIPVFKERPYVLNLQFRISSLKHGYKAKWPLCRRADAKMCAPEPDSQPHFPSSLLAKL